MIELLYYRVIYNMVVVDMVCELIVRVCLEVQLYYITLTLFVNWCLNAKTHIAEYLKFIEQLRLF